MRVKRTQQQHQFVDAEISRREFISNAIAGLAIAVTAPQIISCASASSSAGTSSASNTAAIRAENGKLFVPVSHLTPGIPGIVSHPSMDETLAVTIQRDGGVSAVAIRCTHKACDTELEGDILVCPCHASEFDHTGRVLKGPATLPLRRYDASVVGGEIVVKL